MKYLLPLIMLAALMTACSRPEPIDSTFRWPSSGVEEADSLLLMFERERTSLHPLVGEKKSGERFCSLADRHKDNRLLQFRSGYIKACGLYGQKGLAAETIEKAKSAIDSAQYPYDWHMMNSLLIREETDVLRKYYMIVDNIAYFKKEGAAAEEARHLNYLGNLMAEFKDKNRALESYRKAERIYDSLHLIPNLITVRLNIPLAYTLEESDSILGVLRQDSVIRKQPRANLLLMQNSFIRTDSLQFLEEAIETYRNSDVPRHNLPIILAFKGNYLTRHGDPQGGLKLINEAFDSIGDKPFATRYRLLMHFFRANAYYGLNLTDSAMAEFGMAWDWRDSLDQELNRPGVYALDARTRIEMAERTAHLENVRLVYLLIISILILLIIIMFIVYRYKKRIAEKKHQEKLMAEKLRRNQQSILAQASVMEQSDNIISEVGRHIATLRERGDIDKETADTLMKGLRIHKSNEDNRQGYLKVQQELDTRFMTRLKDDFPSLSEGMLRLASLIAVGIDSRQICSILNIEQASVHKSRYRLRTRLGLKTDDSLEDFLRRYNNPSEP